MALALCAGLAAALLAPMVVAEVSGPVAQIVHADRQTPRIGAEEQARVVPLAHGEMGYIGEFSLVAGGKLTLEPREEEEFLYVLTGSAVLTVDEETFLVGPRMGVYLPAGATIEWVNGSSRLVAVQFLVGHGAGARFEEWRIDTDQAPWPRPRIRPRPAPSGVSWETPRLSR